MLPSKYSDEANVKQRTTKPYRLMHIVIRIMGYHSYPVFSTIGCGLFVFLEVILESMKRILARSFKFLHSVRFLPFKILY